MEVFQELIVKEFLFSVSQGVSVISLFNPVQVGRQTHNLAIMLELSAQTDTLIIQHFRPKVKFIFQRFGLINRGGVYIPQLKQGSFDTEIR